MCSFTALYYAWPTLHGRLASGLSTLPPGSTFSLQTLPIHDSLVIIIFICVLVWY